MGSIEGDIRGRASVNDANEGLRVRLSGRALPDPLPVEVELRRLVLERLDSPVSRVRRAELRAGR